jgi:hypothetical protein
MINGYFKVCCFQMFVEPGVYFFGLVRMDVFQTYSVGQK